MSLAKETHYILSFIVSSYSEHACLQKKLKQEVQKVMWLHAKGPPVLYTLNIVENFINKITECFLEEPFTYNMPTMQYKQNYKHNEYN